MLSATIDRPEDFASWIELAKTKQSIENNIEKKIVYLAPSSHRVVPLSHYYWLTTHNSTIKNVKGTEYEELLKNNINTPILLNSPNNEYHITNANTVKNITNYFKKNRHFVKRQFVLDTLIRYLKINNGLPAICFIFSRKQVEYAANEICFCVLDDDSNIPMIIEQECKNILANKLPNYKEYLELSEYKELLVLLKKGIAIHHAGIISVFREMIEILFEKKYIKLLFATETLAVGINFSTTSVIFTGIEKFNGSTMRMLYPHEYTQMAGRAGRRGIDTVGKVWICGNLIRNNDSTEIKHMITGPPQTLTSQFKISFTLGLNIIANDGNITNFANQSLMTTDINNTIDCHTKEIIKLENNIQIQEKDIQLTRTPSNILLKYKNKKQLLSSSANKQRKRLQRELSNLEVENRYIKQDINKFNELDEIQKQINLHGNYKQNAENHIQLIVDKTIKALSNNKFVNLIDDKLCISELGKIASQFQEVHPLVMAELIYKNNYFNDYSASEIAGLFSCFSNIKVNDDDKIHKPITTSKILNDLTLDMNNLLDNYYDQEISLEINTGSNYERNYDIQQYIINWCNATDETMCKDIINDMKQNSGIFLGEFIKSLLKINNIAEEVERTAELIQNLELIEKMRNIKSLTLKYVATNQSLYI